MYREIMIGNINVPMRASAFTEQIFKSLFDMELMDEVNNIKKSKNIKIYRYLAFVMAWQAMKRDTKISEAVKSLTMDDYMDWIDQFNEVDFFDTATLAQLQKLWFDSTKISKNVVPKKAPSLQ